MIQDKDYVYPGLNTTVMEVPKTSSPISRFMDKLELDSRNNLIIKCIKSFIRSMKQPYNTKDYASTEFNQTYPETILFIYWQTKYDSRHTIQAPHELHLIKKRSWQLMV